MYLMNPRNAITLFCHFPRFTAAKISELLLVLEHPELPLHNNPAELGARTMVQRRNISYGTQTLLIPIVPVADKPPNSIFPPLTVV